MSIRITNQTKIQSVYIQPDFPDNEFLPLSVRYLEEQIDTAKELLKDAIKEARKAQ